MRKFKKLPKQTQILCLFKTLNLALSEDDVCKESWRTDVYGIAAQYGGSYGIEKIDYDMIKNMTIQELTETLLSGA